MKRVKRGLTVVLLGLVALWGCALFWEGVFCDDDYRIETQERR